MKKITLTMLMFLLSHTMSMAQDPKYTLVYGEEVELKKPIVINPSDKRPIKVILDEQLKNTDIDYKITAKHILLFKKKPTPATIKTNYQFHGYVMDSKSHESLIGANVYCPLLATGCTTNAYGYFSMPLPEGEYDVTISYMGYEPVRSKIKLSGNTFRNVMLNESLKLPEVIVESDRPDTGSRSTRMSASTISPQQIMATPAVLGEADVLKSLHLLPGVQQGMSGTNSMSVRGGSTDQNLYLLDGVMLYNVNHFLGLASTFIPEAVKHIDFYSASFPARYGGRLSSVVDVRTKDGDMQNYHGLFSIGLLSAHMAFEGPIKKDRTSFFVSARRSYAGWLMNIMAKQNDEELKSLDLYFYDINAKLTHKFGNNDRVYIGFYQGRDGVYQKYEWEESYYNSSSCTESSLKFGNTLLNARWNHIFSPSVFGNIMVGYNSYRMKLESECYDKSLSLGSTHFGTDYNSGVKDLTAQIDLDHHSFSNHHIKFGGNYTLHKFKPESQTNVYVATDGKKSLADKQVTAAEKSDGHEFCIYIDDDMNLGHQWQLNAGIRATMFAVPSKVYPTIEPRLSVCRPIGGGFRAKASYSLMHQYAHMLSNSPFAMPSDLWVPINDKIKPISSNLWAAGVTYDRWKGIELQLEAYWKEMHNLIEYRDGAGYYGSSIGWSDKVSAGSGRSYGIEFMARKNIGRVTGSFSYTLSKSTRKHSDGNVNNGERYPFELDHTHTINILGMFKLSKKVDLNASWYFATGGYTTIATQQTRYILPQLNDDRSTIFNYEFDSYFPNYYSRASSKNQEYTSDTYYYFGKRNNYKMKPSHRLDLSVNFHFKRKRGERIWNISLMNAYNNKNQDVIYTELVKNENDEKICRINGMTLLTILPSVSYTYKF